MSKLISVPALGIGVPGDDEAVHVVANDDPATWGDDYWEMACGLWVRAFDDGTLVPAIDFYLPREAHRATCAPCRAALWLP
jgi:hypothetical protein